MINLKDLLFCPDFTVSHNRKGPETHEDLASVDSCEYIWESGVGFTISPAHNFQHDQHRAEILKLLLTCFSEAMYQSVGADGSVTPKNRWIEYFTSAENR